VAAEIGTGPLLIFRGPSPIASLPRPSFQFWPSEA